MNSRRRPGFEPRRKPAQARAQATVAAILEASVRILRTEGRAAFNTNRVAEVAGVSIGTLYGYFPDKDSICIALARQILHEDRRTLMAAVDGAGSEDALRVLIHTLLARHRTDREVRRAVMSFYVSSGFGAEHDRLLDDVVGSLARKSGHLLGPEVPAIDPIRLFIVSRAVFGVARALTEQGEASDLPLEPLENEMVGFVRAYLLGFAEPGNASNSPFEVF
ncbi:TetR/AcrR family transcriptional regulator [Rhizobium sp. CG5]|uniref:TetR/AcrR family transcriptional regulator n=1 Tax=Rhizobium sp. CG5 TaxID=2726076 RepID=UPI0020343CAB|nr:TetR/AcrR family transcriptional regulator [Rhizobium sp. CG5]